MKRRNLSFVALFTVMLLSFTACSKLSVSLGQYKGVEVEVTEDVVTDEVVDKAILEEVTKNIEYTEITGRSVENGDVATIDYVGRINGEEFNGGSDVDFDLEVGSGDFIAGFETQMIGMEIGETKDIEVTFPESYTVNEDVAGKQAVFSVTAKAIKIKESPDEVTDEMIKALTNDYSTVESYKAYKRDVLEKEAEENNQNAKLSAVWNAVIENCTIKIDLPEDRVQVYADNYKLNYSEAAEAYGITLEEYLATYMSTTSSTFTEEALDDYVYQLGQTYITEQLIVEAIAEKENIFVSDDEYEAALEEESLSAGMTVRTFENRYGTQVKENLLFVKVRDFTVENAVINYV